MDSSGKYRIHARFSANGIVERNDVVGAVFGQTEGLLGDALDLRSLQASQQVGRIEVEVSSEHGVARGSVQITSDLDRTETAVLAASLETIDRIGPCRATVEVDRIEDIRAAKRRQVFDRAQELIAGGFEDIGVGGHDLVEAVRAATTPVEIGKYAGYPAGPDIEEVEELIIVEGRADVIRLLQFGITNVIGVEGTNVPDEIAALTQEHTVTAFFDGDRGGDLLLLELAQIGDVDFVTFAPPGRSVEDLSHENILDALSEKVPYQLSDEEPLEIDTPPDRTNEEPLDTQLERIFSTVSDDIYLLDSANQVLIQDSNRELDDLLSEISGVRTVIIDGIVGQQEADIASRHDVKRVIGRELGEFPKRPRSVHLLAVSELLDVAQLPKQ